MTARIVYFLRRYGPWYIAWLGVVILVGFCMGVALEWQRLEGLGYRW